MAGTMQTADGFACAFLERFDKGSLCYWIASSNTRIDENRRQPACCEAITLPGEEKEGAGRALAGISVSCQRPTKRPFSFNRSNQRSGGRVTPALT